MANASNATPAVIAACIVDAVGGSANITNLTHCATRLHFELDDAGQVSQHGLESIPGVLGAFPRTGNRYQVIIGGAVASVYEQIVRMQAARLTPATQLPSAASRPTQSAQSTQSTQSTQPTQPTQSAPNLSDDVAPLRDTDTEQSHGPANTSRHFMPRTIREWGSAARARAAAFFDYLSDSFRPILGVLLGASLVIAIVNVIVALGIVPDGETSAGWILLKAIWEGVFTVLPIMIAYNAAKKLDVDPWLGGAIMAALMTPQFTGVMSGMSGTSVSSALSGEIQCSATATFGTETCTVSAFGIPIQLNDYSGNIFVPLLMAAVLAVVYRGLKRVIPDSVQLVFVPFLSLVVVFALTILVIGPLGIWLGSGLGAATAWLNAHVPFLFALIIPMLYPFLVPLGLHWPLNALILMNIQTLGYDFVQGPIGVWNFACFGATAGVLVLAVRGKDSARGIAGWRFGTEPVRHPSASPPRLPLAARRLRGRRSDQRGVRLAVPVRAAIRPDGPGRYDYGIRLLLVADDSGVRSDVGVRAVHRRCVCNGDGADGAVRVPYAAARHGGADGLGGRERTPAGYGEGD